MNNNQNQKFYRVENQNDVIALKEKSPNNIITSYPLLKVKDIAEQVYIRVLQISSIQELENENNKPRKKWIDEGLEAEVLHLGATSWKKGKVRIKLTVEFCVDEPEIQEPSSPLDDIRQAINQ